MLLFIILLVLGLLALILGGFDKNYNGKLKWYIEITVERIWPVVSYVILFCGVIGMGVVGLINKSQAQAEVNSLQQQAIVLEMQWEYLQENDEDYIFEVQSVFNEIQNYNSNVVYMKSLVDNVWIGMFYPDEYLQLEIIELD